MKGGQAAMSQATLSAGRGIRPSNHIAGTIGKAVLYILLILLSIITLIPFVWMLSSSLKLDREVLSLIHI